MINAQVSRVISKEVVPPLVLWKFITADPKTNTTVHHPVKNEELGLLAKNAFNKEVEKYRKQRLFEIRNKLLQSDQDIEMIKASPLVVLKREKNFLITDLSYDDIVSTYGENPIILFAPPFLSNKPFEDKDSLYADVYIISKDNYLKENYMFYKKMPRDTFSITMGTLDDLDRIYHILSKGRIVQFEQFIPSINPSLKNTESIEREAFIKHYFYLISKMAFCKQIQFKK